MFDKAERRFRAAEEKFERNMHRTFDKDKEVNSNITYILPKEWLRIDDTSGRIFERSQIEAT